MENESHPANEIPQDTKMMKEFETLKQMLKASVGLIAPKVLVYLWNVIYM